MSSTFWTNTIWYVLLASSTMLVLTFVMVRSESRKLTFAFFLTVLGITLSFETAILIFFKAYTYYPLILKTASNPFDDVLAGNLFSQFSVSSTVLLVVIFNLKYYWYFVFAAIYGVIEELFLSLGIYSHNWYQTWITVAMLPFAMLLGKILYRKMLQGMSLALYCIYIIFGLFSLNIITLTWGLMLAGLQEMSKTMFSDPIASRHAIVLIHFFVLSASMMFIHFSRPKLMWRALIMLGVFILYYAAYKQNLIWIKEGWFPAISALSITWMYTSIYILDKLYSGPQKKRF